MSQCTNIKHLSNHQEEVGWGENHKLQLKLCIKKIWRELDSDKLLCIKIIESIPLRLAADITAREENKYTKKTIKTKFDSDETWTKVVHIIMFYCHTYVISMHPSVDIFEDFNENTCVKYNYKIEDSKLEMVFIYYWIVRNIPSYIVNKINQH